MGLWGIGLLIYNIFRAIYHGTMYIINPFIDAAEMLTFGFGEGRGRRRERQDERNRQRERGPGSNMRGRSRNGDVNVQVGQKEGDVVMGRVERLGHFGEINGMNVMDGRGMRNMGPQRMGGMGGRPPAYRV